MENIFSIGFTKKSANSFFELLIKNNVNKVVDVRLNNTSQLAGFSKGDDLKYFLKKIADIDYVYEFIFAPTKEILDSYKKGLIDWNDYEKRYVKLMEDRKVKDYIIIKGENYWKSSCLLCSEEKADNCHRRLAINEILKVFPNLVPVHII